MLVLHHETAKSDVPDSNLALNRSGFLSLFRPGAPGTDLMADWGPQGGPLGDTRGAQWCSRAGEALVFLKSERFACTRAPFGTPGAPKGTLGATLRVPWAIFWGSWGALGGPLVHHLGPLGCPGCLPGGARTLLLTNSEASLLILLRFHSASQSIIQSVSQSVSQSNSEASLLILLRFHSASPSIS